MQITMPINSDLFVDTSGWAVYLNSHDPMYTAVDAYVRNVVASQGHLVTTNYVITELVALLSSRYRLLRRQVVTAINSIKNDLSIEVIYIEENLDNEAWKLLETRLDKEWSLVDASSFVVMKRRGMIYALTGDHHFTQAGFIQVPDGL